MAKEAASTKNGVVCYGDGGDSDGAGGGDAGEAKSRA